MERFVNNTLKIRLNIVLIVVLMSLIVGCKTTKVKKNYNDTYKSNALEKIMLSKESKKYSIKKNDIRVSEELIPFHDMGMFFLDSLLAEGFTKSEFGDLNNFNSSIDVTLKALSTNPKSNVHIFYSNEIKNIFFVEVIIDNRKLVKYEDATQAGSSIGYMFKKHDNSIVLVGSVKIHHG